MVSEQPADLDAIFHSLADPTRRAMLRRLSEGDCKMAELAAPFSMSFPAVAKHIRVLEDAGIVTRRAQGRAILVRLEAQRLKTAQAWLQFYEQFWSQRLDALDVAIRENRKDKK
ncbi:MAG: metalloregulator ArsR/SmtB family transcription factor [Haliea sp.]